MFTVLRYNIIIYFLRVYVVWYNNAILYSLEKNCTRAVGGVKIEEAVNRNKKKFTQKYTAADRRAGVWTAQFVAAAVSRDTSGPEPTSRPFLNGRRAVHRPGGGGGGGDDVVELFTIFYFWREM